MRRFSTISHLAKSARRTSQRLDSLMTIINTCSPKETVEVADEISNQLCLGSDLANFVASTYHTENGRKEAGEILEHLHEIIHIINSNESVSNCLQAALWNKDSLPMEHIAVAESLLKESTHFKNANIEELQGLFHHHRALQAGYLNNLRQTQEIAIPQELFHMFHEAYHGYITKMDPNASHFFVELPSHIKQEIIQSCPFRELREVIFKATDEFAERNIKMLSVLVNIRKNLANSLDYGSWKEYNHDALFLSETKEIQNILMGCAESVMEKYKDEREMLNEEMKKQMNGQESEIKPWDEAFLANEVMRQAGGIPIDAVTFPLNYVLDSLFNVLASTFKIQVTPVEMAADECWANQGDLRKYEATCLESGKPLGTVFVDPFPRSGKFHNSALFTIECGKTIPGFLSESSQPERQLPVMSIVANVGEVDAPNKWNQPLFKPEVTTLFHEFGHAVHVLRSQTELQHFSGSRGAPEFGEIPALLMEKLGSHEKIMQSCGESNHKELISAMLKSSNDSSELFGATATLEQVLQSLFDLELSGPTPPKDIKECWSNLRNELLPDSFYSPECDYSWIGRFPHLLTYGGSVYSYLLADISASDIWTSVFNEDPSNSIAGDKVNKMLSFGSSVPPSKCLSDLLGREVNGQAFLSC
eukprot:TRINITY_DN110851_c0_g1_i1.p1 TRINITY_DN110851_c0_g1~~TRINITY_DN110851_c0_g1_i1.p1  ORF type:complete len:647 (-),score=181.19 TRINITY_DN110851_c0_g1_i1:51-1991(-)